jgi:hypothetical protein
MELSPETAVIIVSGTVSAGIAFGIVKGKLYNYITYEKHREICAKERGQTSEALDKLFASQKEAHGMIKEIHGFLKAKNGGQL